MNMICFILSLTLFYLFLLMFVMRWTKFMKSCCFVFSMRKTDACKCMHNFVNGSLGMLLIIWSKYNKIKLNKNCRCFFIFIFLITFYKCFRKIVHLKCYECISERLLLILKIMRCFASLETAIKKNMGWSDEISLLLRTTGIKYLSCNIYKSFWSDFKFV